MPNPSFYIDLRPAHASEQISLDLSRHLLCRMTAGNILIIANQPRIFCSVLRRRWKRIIQETELQYCLTMDRTKKRHLAQQLERLKELQFSSKQDTPCDVLVVSPQQVASPLPACATLYIATELPPSSHQQLPSPAQGGLIVVYQPFWREFIQALTPLLQMRKTSA